MKLPALLIVLSVACWFVFAGAEGEDGEAAGGVAPKVPVQTQVQEPAQRPVQQDPHPDDIPPEGCRPSIAIYCQGEVPGEQRLLHCLTKVMIKQWDGQPGVSVAETCQKKMLEFKLKNSKSIDNDVYLNNACKVDVENLCKNESEEGTRVGAVVACLREKRKETSPECRKEVLRVMREAAFDYRLDADLHTKCEDEVGKHCKGVFPGEGRVLSCLNEKIDELGEDSKDCKKEIQRQAREDAGFDLRCRKVVVETLFRHLRDMNQDVLLSDACSKYIADPCGESSEEFNSGYITFEMQQRIWKCIMIDHRDKVAPKCRKQVQRILKNQFTDLKLNPLLKKCQKDIDTYCSSTPSQTEGQVIECLIENRRKGLNKECSKELFQERELRNENINFNRPLKRACAPDITRFCKQVEPGDAKMLQCLADWIEDENMSHECKDKLESLLRGRAQDYRLDHELRTACDKDARIHCSDKCSLGDGEVCNGKVIDCLLWKISEEKDGGGTKKVSQGCQAVLSKLADTQSQDYRRNEVVAQACVEEAEQLCVKPTDSTKAVQPGRGRIFQCLFDNLDKLNDDCKEQEIRFKIMQAGNLKRQPKAFMKCQRELYNHCPKIQPVKEAALGCLLTYHHLHPDSFTSDCKTALMRVSQSMLKDYRFNEALKVHCEHAISSQCKEDGVGEPQSEINNGTVIHCLISSFSNLDIRNGNGADAPCSHGVMRVVQRAFDFYKHGSRITGACDSEVEKICTDVRITHGQCLMDAFHSGDSRLTTECKRLLDIANPMDLRKVDKSQGAELDKKAMEIEVSKSMVAQLKSTIEESARKSSMYNRSSMDSNTVIGIVVPVGVVVAILVAIGVFAVRRYIRSGYVVLKNGSA